jgi:hypothetical protein
MDIVRAVATETHWSVLVLSLSDAGVPASIAATMSDIKLRCNNLNLSKQPEASAASALTHPSTRTH